MNQTEEDFQKAAEEALEYATAQDKMKALFIKMVPVIETFAAGFRGIVEFMASTAEYISALLPLLLGLYGVLKILALVAAAFGAGAAAMVAPFIVGAAAVGALIYMLYQLWDALHKRGSWNLLEIFSPTGLAEGVAGLSKNLLGASSSFDIFSDSALKTKDALNEEGSWSVNQTFRRGPRAVKDLGVEVKKTLPEVKRFQKVTTERAVAPMRPRETPLAVAAADTTGAPSTLRATFALALDGAATKDLLEGAVANVVVDGILQTQ